MKYSLSFKDSVNFVDVMGFKVFSDRLEKISLGGREGCLLINTISPNSYGISTKDADFSLALKNSDYLVLDGVYFGLSSFFLLGKTIKKNQGPDVFRFFMQRMNEIHGKVFFLGSSNETLIKIRNKAKNEFPNIQIQYFSPPFKDVFDNHDDIRIVEAINSFSPDLLFVGMTCPKQEKWAFKNRSNINASLICCIGAVFDWYAGNQKNIHPIWWKLRLGWFKRTIDRPEILLRYPSIGIFFRDLFLFIIRLKK